MQSTLVFVLAIATAACGAAPPSARLGPDHGLNDKLAESAARQRAATELSCPDASLTVEEVIVQADAHPTLRVRGCGKVAQYTCLLVQGIHWQSENGYWTGRDTVCIREPAPAATATP
jgi:hypothetical protein